MDSKKWLENSLWVYLFFMLSLLLLGNAAAIILLSIALSSVILEGSVRLADLFFFMIGISFANFLVWFWIYSKLFQKDWKRKLWNGKVF